MIESLKNTWNNGWSGQLPVAPESFNWLLHVVGISNLGDKANAEMVILRFLVVVVVILAIVMVTTRSRRRRPRIPNFMVWVGGGHRRERTELGLAGVYLDRRPVTPAAAAAAVSSTVRPRLRRVRSCSAAFVDKRTASPISLAVHNVPVPIYPVRHVHCAMSAPLITTPALAAAVHVREMAAPAAASSEFPMQPALRYSRTV